MARPFLAAAILLGLAALPFEASAGDGTSLADTLKDPGKPAFEEPSLFDEAEPIVAAAPAGALAYALPAGTTITDFEVSPLGNEVALVTEDAGHHQHLAFWQFAADGFARSVDVPADTHIASLTWHPQGKAVFLLATGTGGSRILKLDPASPGFVPALVFKSDKPLRRLVVGPRPFMADAQQGAVYRLFFGEKLANGNFALRTVTEAGSALYTVVGPRADRKDPKQSEDYGPNTTIAPSALPVEFHPAGNILIWEDEKTCLHKTAYASDNWGKTEAFGTSCGSFTFYTPNGSATLEWQPKTPGLRLRGLIDKTDQTVLGDFSLTSLPSQTPDGSGVVGLTVEGGSTTIRYLPIAVPLAQVVNAWMYLEDADDQARFVKDRGLFRDLAENDQIYQLYDSESYLCGGPDSRLPTRPYYVTTDLFWEVYGAAFDGLFIVVEREQSIPAFKRFLDAAAAELQKNHADTALAKAFAAAQAVLDTQESGNAEARSILAASGAAPSPALGSTIDYGQFKPRGHYKTDEQKRYFGAMRYLSLMPLSEADVALLRGLAPEVAAAAQAWIASYRPFIAESRADLVWDNGAKNPVASHAGPPGARIFPLSWAWDNEALDNVVDHSDWPAAEQIVARDGKPRTLPSGLDFAAIAGNTEASQLPARVQLLAEYPNLGARIQAVHQRFAEASKRGTGSLYEQWITALATQWADAAAAPLVSGPLWQSKRLQTGLASWATLRHSTILVNDQTAAECGEGGFEDIVMRPPRGYVEPDPETFAAIAGLFDATIELVKANPIILGSAANDTQLRDGIIRRLAESRDDARNYQKIAGKERAGTALTAEDYQSIQYVGGAVEHNFLVFMSLSNPEYALSTPDPMMKIADVAGAGGAFGSLEAAVGRPLEWDQIVPYYGRQEIVKGAVYSYYEFTANEPLDDEQWRAGIAKRQRPDWIGRYLAKKPLECPAREL